MNVELQDFIAAAPTALSREVSLPGLPQGADPSDRSGSGRMLRGHPSDASSLDGHSQGSVGLRSSCLPPCVNKKFAQHQG
jgi:hypothetical protein